MNKLKKTVLMIAGPGVVLVEIVAIYIHLFTSQNAKPWIVGGLLTFLVLFIPLYSVEYFKHNFKDKRENKAIQFKKRNTRTEWEGGNIHGKIPTQTERPGKVFRK